jgi:thiol-disulfide isomerase/thioredoxin
MREETRGNHTEPEVKTMRHSTLPRRGTFRMVLLALAALTAMLGAGAAASAQGVPADSVLRGFQRTGDYLLVVDGKPQPAAEIYQLSDRVPAFLILSSALPSPVLLTPGSGSVETVQIMKIAKRKDGSVDLLADASLSPQGQFKLVGEDVEFRSEGRRGVLKPRPPLLGPKRAGDLVAYSPEYGRGAQAYNPNGQAIARLRKGASPVKVRIFFGSWCSHCKEHVPYVIKVEEMLRGSKVQFEYFGLPRGMDVPEAKRLSIRSVPTGVVYVNGKEAGRITGNGWEAPETALANILSGRGGKVGG